MKLVCVLLAMIEPFLPGYLVYKLQKVLRTLKQTLRAWYSRIKEYFLHLGFERSKHEPTFYVK